MKKLLALFIAVAMLASYATTSLAASEAVSNENSSSNALLAEKTETNTNAEDTPTYEGFTYSVNSDNEVVIEGYTGSETEIEIPSTIDGMSVTDIGYYAFENCNSLTSVPFLTALLISTQVLFAVAKTLKI